jgi:hypothetical protein
MSKIEFEAKAEVEAEAEARPFFNAQLGSSHLFDF